MSSSPSSEDGFSCGASPRPPAPALHGLKRAAQNSCGRKRSRANSRASSSSSGETPVGSEEDVDPNENEHERAKRLRKEQRMHRNRLSAARSRKRKEDMLETLSKENRSLRDELNRLKSQLAAATSQACCRVPNARCEFCRRALRDSGAVSPGCGSPDLIFGACPPIEPVFTCTTEIAAPVEHPEKSMDPDLRGGSVTVGHATSPLTLCAPANHFNNDHFNDPHLAIVPNHAAAAAHVTAREPTPAVAYDDQQQDAAEQPSPPVAFDVGDDAAIIDLIISDDLDFTMDCFDVPSIDGSEDDLLQGLL